MRHWRYIETCRLTNCGGQCEGREVGALMASDGQYGEVVQYVCPRCGDEREVRVIYASAPLDTQPKRDPRGFALLAPLVVLAFVALVVVALVAEEQAHDRTRGQLAECLDLAEQGIDVARESQALAWACMEDTPAQCQCMDAVSVEVERE